MTRKYQTIDDELRSLFKKDPKRLITDLEQLADTFAEDPDNLKALICVEQLRSQKEGKGIDEPLAYARQALKNDRLKRGRDRACQIKRGMINATYRTDPFAPPAKSAEDDEIANFLTSASRELPERDHRVLRMFVGGANLRTIAGALELSGPGQACKILHRVFKHLEPAAA